jgi:hypothetical protein
MSNKMGSEDLIDYQEDSREIPYCQEGKGDQMNSELNSDQQMQLIEREDQRDLLMIGGIAIFLASSRGEVKVFIIDATKAREKQPDVTIKELEKTQVFSQAVEEDEHSKEWLNIFSQEDENPATLKLTVEEEENIIDFVALCEQLEALERRVMVQSMHIQ